MKIPEKCTICGKSIDLQWTNLIIRDFIALIKQYRGILLVRESVNPGGRELIFQNANKQERRIQLFDCCGWCDFQIIKKELEGF